MSPQIRSIADMFLKRVAATPDREAFRYPTDPGWKSLTWREVSIRVRAIACGLRALGLQDEQRAAILSSTRVEWILVDLGIICAGGATTTIYPSNTADECAYILSDSDSRVVFVESADQLAKVNARRAELPCVTRVIVMDGTAPDDGWTLSLAALVELGRQHDEAHPGAFDAVIARITPRSLATLIYTSGTTGKPKGVELTHDNWIYEGTAIDALGIVSLDDLQYLWLPLSHSFGKVLQAMQLQIGFATAVDGRVDKLVDQLAEVQPTIVAAVPRVFEKVHNRVVLGAQEGGGLKLKIFEWAMGVGRKVSALALEGKEPTGLLALQHALADRLVFSKLRARFGNRLRFFISGSAALSKDIGEFFHAAGILVAEGYGLTESSAATFVNRPGHVKFGTVGQPMPGTEVRIAPEDGEVLLRGRGIMRGYHHMPEATAETLDPDGWLHTGDIGEVDAENFLKITDRKKDLIKTSGGKYVAPQALEGKLKALCPYVSQVLVHGDRRNFCTALVTIDEEVCRKALAEHADAAALSREALANDRRITALIQGYVDELNRSLASYETIKKFALLPYEFTIDAGELTPSQKIKRKVVEAKYRDVLDGFYEGTDARSQSVGR
jgi:long-chain acyl-CoA synthetase